jgi:hypothetical protein
LETGRLHAQRHGIDRYRCGFDEVSKMFRNFLPAFVLLSVAAMPLAAYAATPFELKSVKIDLPDSNRMLPEGPGSDAINKNCLACHSAGMILNQPALSKQAWAAEVNKMINNYKAPIGPEDVGTIVDYLTGQGREIDFGFSSPKKAETFVNRPQVIARTYKPMYYLKSLIVGSLLDWDSANASALLSLQEDPSCLRFR